MIRWLVLAFCLLSSVVAAELLYGPDRAPQTSALAAASQPSPSQAVRRSADDKGSHDRWLAAALARPLFSPDRKPFAGMLATDPAMPRLTGIISSPGGDVAIFQPEGHVKPVVMRHGDILGGWEITAVAANTVNLQKAGDRIVLMPSFENSQTGAAERAAARPPPSRWEAAAPTGVLRARWSNPLLQP